MTTNAAGGRRIFLGGNTINTTADQTVSSSAATVISGNTNRDVVIIGNQDGSVAIRVGDSNVTSSRGIRIPAGESATLSYRGALYAISEGADVTVDVNEVEFSAS